MINSNFNHAAVGNRWGIASVNTAVTTDSNRLINFKFIINDETSVTYDACFEFSNTQYRDRYSSALNAIEQNSYIRISDMKRIIRDYPDITNTQISNIFIRLTNTCLECVKHEINNLNRYILCATLDGSKPKNISIPELPFNIDPPIPPVPPMPPYPPYPPYPPIPPFPPFPPYPPYPPVPPVPPHPAPIKGLILNDTETGEIFIVNDDTPDCNNKNKKSNDNRLMQDLDNGEILKR